MVDRGTGAPELLSAVVDQNDPGRYVFNWTLVPGAERYIICVAEPGANCEGDSPSVYKSSILGPAVDTYPMTIPVFLAPDGQETQLNWTVAACDANLNCVWQPQTGSFTVDRTGIQQISYPLLADWDAAAGWMRLEFNGPGGQLWEYHVGGETYRVNADGSKTLVSSEGESLSYPLLIENDGTAWMLGVSADRSYHAFRRYDSTGSTLVPRADLPANAEANIPLDFREEGGRQYPRIVDWSVAQGWIRTDTGGGIWEYHIGGTTYRVNADGSKTLVREPEDSLSYPLLIESDGTTWKLGVSADRTYHAFTRVETGGSVFIFESELPAAAVANIPPEFQ